MINSLTRVNLFFLKWKILHACSSIKYSCFSIFKTSRIYPTLLFLYIVAISTGIATYNFLSTTGNSADFILKTIIVSEFATFTSFYLIGVIAILYFIAAFFIWAFKMRGRIVIETFEEDEEKDQKQKDLNGPLHHLLTHELCRIFELYSDVDKRSPVSTIVPVVPTTNVTVSVENVSNLLSSMVTEDSVITFGPLKIPAKILLALFGRFFEAKKIRGSLSYSDQEIIIIASFTGAERCHCWKVHRPYPPPTSSNSDSTKKSTPLDEKSARGLLIREMIEELAYRIFTDLSEFHSFRWEATKEFMIGLECYRACLLEPKEKISKLLDAESAFMKALTEDVTFSIGWYNLGVVYTELRFLDAATMAFYKSFERERIHYEPFYALALNFYNAFIKDPDYGTAPSDDWKAKWIKKLNDAVFFCEHAELLSKKKGTIGIGSWKIPLEFLSTANPEIFLLKGRINLELYYLTRQSSEEIKGNNDSTEEDTDRQRKGSKSYLNKSIEAFHEAIRYSYREWAELDYYQIHAPLVQLDDNEHSIDSKIKWDNFRERIAELGWAYVECAAKESDIDLRKNLLETSFFIYSQGFTFDPKKVDIESSEFEYEKRKEHICSPKYSQYFKKIGLLSKNDASCILGNTIPPAIYLWKYGVLSSSASNFPLADFFIQKALVQNPRAFLFQTSHILIKILKNNNQDPSNIKDYWWHSLQHARNAYKADTQGYDYQWGYITEFANLISKFQPKYYRKVKIEKINESPNLEEKNRLKPLILNCDLTQSGGFGKYLLSVFSIFEILTINLDDRKNFVKNLQEKITFEDGNTVANELIILNSVKSELYQKLKENPTINESQILGYIELHQNWVIGQIYLYIGYSNNFSKENAKIAQFAFEKSRKYLGQYDMELNYRGVYANESGVESHLSNYKKSLSKAWQSHWKDSTNHFEHLYLGSIQFDIEDFSNAHISYSDAEFWGMQELKSHELLFITINRAHSLINKSRDYPVITSDKKGDMRRKYLEIALESHKRTLKFAEYNYQKNLSDHHIEKRINQSILDLNSLLTIQFWMGVIYLRQMNYPEAIEKFRVIKNLTSHVDYNPEKAETKKDFERFCIASSYLGHTYLEYGQIADAENEYLLLIKSIFDEVRQRNNIDTKIDLDFEIILTTLHDEKFGLTLLAGGLSYKKILFYSYLALAKIYCLQLCNKEKIIENTQQAIRIFNLKKYDNPDLIKKRITIENEYSAEIEKIKGLAYLRICHNAIKALEHLKKAVCIHADPEAYVFLFFTQVLRLKTLPEINKAECMLELNNIYALLRKMGIPNEYCDDVDSMYKEIIHSSDSSEKNNQKQFEN